MCTKRLGGLESAYSQPQLRTGWVLGHQCCYQQLSGLQEQLSTGTTGHPTNRGSSLLGWADRVWQPLCSGPPVPTHASGMIKWKLHPLPLKSVSHSSLLHFWMGFSSWLLLCCSIHWEFWWQPFLLHHQSISSLYQSSQEFSTGWTKSN